MTKEERKDFLKRRVQIVRLREKAKRTFTEPQLFEFRKKLKIEKRTISEEIKSFSGAFKEEFQEVKPCISNHIADTNTCDSAVNESLITNRLKRLKKIREALQCLDEGTYGICKKCEEPINVNRLLCTPSTRFCTNCKNAQNPIEARKAGEIAPHRSLSAVFA